MPTRPPTHSSTHSLLILACFFLLACHPSLAQSRKIAIFGSSVAKGSGDTTGSGGYAGMITRLLEKRGWEVVNVSRGGDNTSKIKPRFETDLLPQKPGYVIIGLSLGNEGIASASDLNRQRISEHFRSGVLELARLCRENGMVPVVVNCYGRNDFGPAQYEAVRQMNLLINTWDMPSINVLGAVEDGAGKWAPGCWHDKSHPDVRGHREMYFSFVPTLFDALAAGKKCPVLSRNKSYLAISGGGRETPLTFTPGDTIHSFAFCFKVRTSENGTIAGVMDPGTTISVSITGGRISCGINGTNMPGADTTSENKGWQYVVLSYRYATSTAIFYVNGREAARCQARLEPAVFSLGGGGTAGAASPKLAAYKDLMIYRSSLNDSEVTALYHDCLLQSSLEIYAPLDDSRFEIGTEVRNLAQSMSKMMVNSSGLVHVAE